MVICTCTSPKTIKTLHFRQVWRTETGSATLLKYPPLMPEILWGRHDIVGIPILAQTSDQIAGLDFLSPAVKHE